jgi:lipoprotein signal peptidase
MLNKGISFGMFPGISNFIIFFVIVALIAYAVKVRELIVRVGLMMMIGGGSANLYQRIVNGGVRDNLNFFGLFYNNIFDYLIVGGVVLIVISILKSNNSQLD